MSLLEIKNLHVEAGGHKILRGVDLMVNPGEVHSIMGPNGSGKSTLAQVLARRESYNITAGEVLYDGKDLLAMKAEEAACEGVFLAFQYPVEIPGISNANFLRSALNAVRKYRGLDEMDAMDFIPLFREKLKLLEMDEKQMNRSLNEGFSGGEKKRNEILQMAMLEPRLAILDETDSGLDIDALKVVAKGVNSLRQADRAIVVVTHYQRLLNYIVPDFVHVLVEGRIVRSGGPELALELEDKGYGAMETRAPSAVTVLKKIGTMITRMLVGSRNIPSTSSRRLIRTMITQGATSKLVRNADMPCGIPSRVSRKELNSPPVRLNCSFRVAEVLFRGRKAAPHLALRAQRCEPRSGHLPRNRADARDHLVDPHLDRLRERDGLAGQRPQFLLDQARQFGLRAGLPPVVAGP